MDTRGHRRPDPNETVVADELDAVVVFDLDDVRSVVELAVDSNKHDLTIGQLARMTTESLPNEHNRR